ncbi:MAG: RagB/SusD family nutrient uptake outer membrane protein [Bacteroidota bacterium]|nr:RagB/SusD family nutrient uptake outer membrane protein [Bacteroidota bacterium]
MKKYNIILLLFVLLFTACNEDRLDITQKGVVNPSQFYITDADANSALVDAYANFVSNIGGNDGIYVPYNIVFNYCADNVLAAGAYYGDNDQFGCINEFRYDPQSSVVSTLYKRFYYAIYHCNLVITHFKYGESAIKDRCISEARVMRAWCHMMLAMAWNNPPLIDHVLVGSDKPGNYAGGHDALLQWCADECADASKYLDERASTADKDGAVKVTKGFAWTVQGKALLYKGDYANAKTALKKVIDSGKYALVSGDRWASLFHLSGDGCEEKVFEGNIVNSSSIGDWSGKIQRSTWMESNLWGWRTDRLASQPTCQADGGWGGLAVEENFANAFAANDGSSYRRKATIVSYDEFVTDPIIGWATDATLTTRDQKLADSKRGISYIDGLYGQCGYLQKKHIVAAEDRSTNWYRFNNFIIERYADVLLMYAEACANTSDADGSGLKALTDVQNRAGSAHVSSALTLADVKKERNFELWMEGSRWIDMKRWNEFDKAKTAGKHIPSLKDHFFDSDPSTKTTTHVGYVTYSEPNAGKTVGFQAGKHEWFPYPYSETSINPNIKQNPGW